VTLSMSTGKNHGYSTGANFIKEFVCRISTNR
jgi:hypothetical protein